MSRRAAGIAGILVAAFATALVPGCAGKKKSEGTSEFLAAPELIALAEAELADRDFRKSRTYLERVTYSPATGRSSSRRSVCSWPTSPSGRGTTSR